MQEGCAMRNDRLNWLLLIGIAVLAILAGCSEDEAVAPEEEIADEQAENEAASEDVEEEPEPAEESRIPEAAVHNVEEMVKEKGKYVQNEMTEQQRADLQKELEAAPDGMTGEEAYALAVSLFAADIEEAARIINETDPVI